jgi:hypothetical protein
MATAQEWKLRNGTARAFPANDQDIVKPVIMAGKARVGTTDLDAFEAGVDHASYSFLAELHARGYDLILVGHNKGDAPLGDLAKTVQEAIHQAISRQYGDAPLTVGGIGTGALTARYTLAQMEREAIDHRTATCFSYDETAPSQEENKELDRLGQWPMRPRKLGLVSGGTSHLILDPIEEGPFDDAMTGAPNPGGPLITNELGSWLLERLY